MWQAITTRKICCPCELAMNSNQNLFIVPSMLKNLRLISALFCALLTFSCSQGPHDPQVETFTPLSFEPVDPDDTVLLMAVRRFLEQTGAPVASRFEYARIDLNDDGRRDALVLFQTPYGFWCATHGCTMLILRAHDDDFSIINSVQPVREPLYVSNLKTNGWKDMVTRVAGRSFESKDVALKFNGQTYPSNPAILPPYNRDHRLNYVRVFYD